MGEWGREDMDSPAAAGEARWHDGGGDVDGGVDCGGGGRAAEVLGQQQHQHLVAAAAARPSEFWGGECVR